jgi:NifU-like protein involved in Fe-S cluster formation
MPGDLYTASILERATNVPRRGRLAHPHASAHAHARLCGSDMIVDLCLDHGIITDFAHEGKACALGTAAASIVARQIIGASVDELRLVRIQMRAMLKNGGPPPSGARWQDLAMLEPMRDFPARHGSLLLVFEALVMALDTLALDSLPAAGADILLR